MVPARPAAILAAVVLGMAPLTGCGIAGSAAPPQALTPALVQVAASDAPASPGATDSEEPTESPTQSVDPTAPTTEPTDSASGTASDSPSPTSASPTDSSSPAATDSESTAPDESAPSSLPLAFGLVGLAAAGGALVLILTRLARRRRWDEQLEVERAQGQWIIAELVPALTDPAAPAHQVVQHWAQAAPTLDQFEANVAGLELEAPDDARAAQARAISSAATQVRSSAAAHVALVGSAVADRYAVATSAQALATARGQLAAALGNTA